MIYGNGTRSSVAQEARALALNANFPLGKEGLPIGNGTKYLDLYLVLYLLVCRGKETLFTRLKQKGKTVKLQPLSVFSL